MNLSAEVIFPVGPSGNEPCVFRYDIGPTASKVAKKRGRPKGSTKNLALQSRSNTHAFEFIHIDSHSGIPDADSRKSIRRQVMINHIQRKKYGDSLIPSLSSQIAGVDPFSALPIRLEPYMHDLLKYYITTGWQKYYCIEKQTAFNPITEYWLSLIMVDDAFLHTILGCADIHLSPGHSPRASLTTIKHLNAAINIVNKRIEDNKIPTDATLVIVATMAIIEKHRGSHENWSIHLEGLRKLVTLRGGLESLEPRPLVVGKLHRADLTGSIDAAQKPYFSRGLSPPMKSDPRLMNPGFQMLNSLNPFDDTLISCIQTAADIMHSMEKLNIKSPHAEAARIRYCSTAMLYTLLSVKYSNSIHEICRLSLLLLSEILVNQGSLLLSNYEMLITRIWDIYEAAVENIDLFPPEFGLWVFLVVASCTTSEPTKRRCLHAVSEAASTLNVTTKEEVDIVLETFLWNSTFKNDVYHSYINYLVFK